MTDLRTPLEIDTRLAILSMDARETSARINGTINTAHRATGDRGTQVRKGMVWKTTDVEAIEACRKLADGGEYVPGGYYPVKVMAEYDRLVASLATIHAEADTLEAIYANNPWTRFFLVTSSDGHIHRDMHCSTCNFRTTYTWQPELSGKTEAEAVTKLGPLLCTVCYSHAPVEHTRGRDKPAGCSGSGQTPKANTARRTGMNTHAECAECGSRELLNATTGYVRKHKPATT